jgi:5-methylcytosine-specific restriction endonuclease McrA
MKKELKTKYHRHKIYDLTILDKIHPKNRQEKWRDIDGVNVKLRSQRYTLFRKSTTCCKCGLEATFMASERDYCSESNNYHLNLYGIRDGLEILFTKDHILPKSKGGKNNLLNYQTMCVTCNLEKGNKIEND